MQESKSEEMVTITATFTVDPEKFARGRRKRPTKAELIRWLEAEVSVGHVVTVSPVDFDIRDIILETHFEVDRSDHLAYRLVVDRIKDGTWVWSNDTPPEIRYEVSVRGVCFALETTFENVQDGKYEWSPEKAIETGDGADAHDDADAKLRELLHRYAIPELPDADNCNLPCEGVSWDLLASSLNALIAEGAELYTDGEVVKAKFPNDDDRDFDGYRYLHGETEAASILDETLEYELDWTKLQEREGESDD